MKTFSLAYVSFFDNILTQKIVKADDWREALSLSGYSTYQTRDVIPDTLDTLIEEYFDQGSLISILDLEGLI